MLTFKKIVVVGRTSASIERNVVKGSISHPRSGTFWASSTDVRLRGPPREQGSDARDMRTMDVPLAIIYDHRTKVILFASNSGKA
jgi:hypothetical protein